LHDRFAPAADLPDHGRLIPLALLRLARNLGADRRTALLAGLLCAASPRLIAQSVRVMVDSAFPCVVTFAFAAAAWRPPDAGPRAWLRDALAGVLLGVALLLRGAALVAVPAAVVLLLAGRPWRRALPGLGLAVLGGALAASPFLLRNLRLFGTPFYSDVGAYGIWPYVDALQFSTGSSGRPPRSASRSPTCPRSSGTGCGARATSSSARCRSSCWAARCGAPRPPSAC
jgi:4-amino-4-deoxy-L-arabinose transferase-like glycosyltransferase